MKNQEKKNNIESNLDINENDKLKDIQEEEEIELEETDENIMHEVEEDTDVELEDYEDV